MSQEGVLPQGITVGFAECIGDIERFIRDNKGFAISKDMESLLKYLADNGHNVEPDKVREFVQDQQTK